MALSEQNIQERVAQELALKLRLERPLAVKLRQLFRQMAKDFRAIYSATGQALDASEYEADFLGLLRPVYRKAAAQVGETTRDNIKSAWDVFETKQAEVDNAIRNFVQSAPEERAAVITETNNKQISAAIMAAITSAAVNGETPTNETIAFDASREFLEDAIPRGDMIAMTEVLNAVEGSKFTELETLIAVGATVGIGIELTRVIDREWVAVLDNSTRSTHVNADGQRRGLMPFDIGNSKLRFPGDTSLGADIKEVINCLHPDSKVFFSSPEKLFRHKYNGKMISISTSGGDKLTVTPNHPVLTCTGWVKAAEIKKGGSVIGGIFANESMLAGDIKNMIPTVKEVYDSFAILSRPVRVNRSKVNFHGEIPDEDVDVISTNRRLENPFESSLGDPFEKLNLTSSDLALGFEFCHRLLMQKSVSFFPAPHRLVGRFDKLLSFLQRSAGHPLEHCFTSVSMFYSRKVKNFFNSASLCASNFKDFLYRVAGVEHLYNLWSDFFVARLEHRYLSLGTTALDMRNSIANGGSFVTSTSTNSPDRHSFEIESLDVLDVHSFDYSGYVYNLEDKKGYYTCNGVVNHNCRCGAFAIVNDSEAMDARLR